MARARRTCCHLTWANGVQTACPRAIASGNRCAEHAAALEAARGTRQARGYDAAYDAARRAASRAVAAGRAFCWRDGELIEPGSD